MTRQGRAERGQPLDTTQDMPSAHTRVKLPPDPYSADRARRPRGRGVLIFIAALLAVLGVIAVVNRGGRDTPAPAASAGSTTTTTTGAAAVGAQTGSAPAATSIPFADGLPQSDAQLIPTGYPDTLSGAESAASNYVVAYNSAQMLQPAVRHTFVADTADPAIIAARQVDLDNIFGTTAHNLGLTAAGLAPAGSTLVEQAAPLGVHVVTHDPKAATATVAVWVVTVGGLAGSQSTAPVTSAWYTVTVTLHYTHGDWKWQSFSQTDGPTPISGQQTPSTNQQWQTANGFGGLRYAR
jgi:hypothetical protein